MMKRTVIILLLNVLVVNGILYCQEIFAPNGAKWHYSLREDWQNTGEGYRLFEVEKDTAINGQECKKITVTDTYKDSTSKVFDEIYVYEDTGKVYYYAADTFHLLYDFSVDSGDYWLIRKPFEHYGFNKSTDSLVLVQVDSVLYDTTATDTLRLLYTSCFKIADTTENKWYFKNPIAENIGSPYFFPAYWYDYTGQMPNLRCYEDTSILYQKGNKPCDTIIADYYQEPAWVMPIFFEDANGEKDTVFIGYDENATSWLYYKIDTIFDENYKEVDTSRFLAFLWGYPNYDPGSCNLFNTNLIIKRNICSAERIFVEIGFINGQMPITMKWVDSLLNSPALPFPDISPRPRARMDMYCSSGEPGYINCPWDSPLIALTGYPTPDLFMATSDSFYFDGSGEFYTPCRAIGNFNLSVVPHNTPYVNIKENNKQRFQVFPNPFEDHISFSSNQNEIIAYELINIAGQVCLKGEFTEHLYLDTSIFPPGVYIVKFSDNLNSFIYKLLKTN